MTRFRQLLPWGLVLLLLGWWSQGVWPVVPVEGDEQGVLFGAEGMLRNDPVLLNVRYLYQVQPGSYHLLVALARLTGGSIETIFGVTTVVGAIGFVLAGARLLQILLGWPLAWILVGLLWCQEVTTAACYMNTSALAGGPALLGVILAGRPQRLGWLWAGLALAVAGWLRADSLLVAPACLGLAYWTRREWRPAFLHTTALALTALAGVLLLYGLGGASLLSGFTTYTGRGTALSGWRTLIETSLLLLSPGLALGATGGCVVLLWRRQHALGLVVLGGTAASVLAYGFSLTSPKYFYYLVPFALVPALVFIDWVGQSLRHRPAWQTRLAAGAGLALVAVDGLLGLRTLSGEQRLFTTAPTFARLFEAGLGAKSLAVVIGPGELVINADGFRLRTGQAFAPRCWHREKKRMKHELATIREWLEREPDLTLLWSNWIPYQMISRELFAAGYRPVDPPRTVTGLSYQGAWQRGAQRVRVAFLGYVQNTHQEPGGPPVIPPGALTYFVGDCAFQPINQLPDARQWHLVSAVPEGFLTLFQRR